MLATKRLMCTAVMLAVGSATLATTGVPAFADTQICSQYGTSTTQGGKYVVMNNVWGAKTAQCITVTGTGFKIDTASHNNSTSGAPAAYPAVYAGCHYGNCTQGKLPAPLSSLGDVRSKVTIGVPDTGEWDAAYDIWYDPTARRTGQNTGAELMVWLNHRGRPQPAGSKVATATVDGATWDVWYQKGSWNIVSYVRQTPTTSFDGSLSAFTKDCLSRGYIQQSWYLTSVQYGFEPWIGGAGLRVDSFDVSI